MLRHIQKTACALAIFAISTNSIFAASIDIKVIGTISPAACTPTISGGATIDYGLIKHDSLKKDAFTVLAEKTLDFAIACSAPAKVAITATSGRGASAVNADGTLSEASTNNALFGASNITAYGLGLAETKGIGGYGIQLKAGTITADSTAVESIFSDSNLTSWAKDPSGSLASIATHNVSWAMPGTTVPLAFTTLAGKIGVQAYINKTSELDLTKEITLDGLTTIELVYL